MTKQLRNEMSDAQLDAISGGCDKHYEECGGGYRRDNDCDDSWKKSCGGERHKKQRRDYDDCRPSYRSNRCG